MSKTEKTIKRLLARPADFSWTELRALMIHFNYELKTSGGSGRKFIHKQSQATFFIHEPHPAKVLKSYQVRDAIHFLRQERHIS